MSLMRFLERMSEITTLSIEQKSKVASDLVIASEAGYTRRALC